MTNKSEGISYPPTRKCEQVDDYHGTQVPDPYRWLEDPDSEETRDWVKAQNKVSSAILSAARGRDAIKKRYTQLMDYENRGIPWRQGRRWFYYHNTGLQNQDVLFTTTNLNGPRPRVLLDPNKLSEDGTVALSGISITDDGNLLAYSISHSGSDWQEWHVKDVRTGEDLPDVIKWAKFSGATWTKDGKGFYYARYDEPKDDQDQALFFQKVYYHELGTDQCEDVLVYERKDQPEWGFAPYITQDGRYLLIYVWHGTDPKNRIFYKDLQAGDAEVVELLPNGDASYSLIANDGPLFWIHTDLDAPKGRVVAINVDKFDASNPQFEEVIPEGEETLESVGMLDVRFVAEYLKDAHSQVKIFDRHGNFIREVDLPGIGTAGGFHGKMRSRVTFYSYEDFSRPDTIYKYDMRSGESTVYFQPKLLFKPGDFVTRQVFFESKDGTRVPMTITHKKGLKKDGSNPTYLYGYGGFNISLTPGFSSSLIVWMEMGGIFAQANLRGGGEYGEEWHQAGTKHNKQNVFDDFIAAAEWLIENKYTSKPKLAIGGGSNGGLLVGACETQRPEDLFGACVPAVGVMDMLRFHKFTIGHAWTSDYGSSDDPEEFKALYAYSPLHNIKPGVSYPPTLVMTADHDDRVVPAHSYKFIATLQAAHAGTAPVIIRIEEKAGHGAGKPTAKIIEEVADKWGFLVEMLEMPTPVFGSK